MTTSLGEVPRWEQRSLTELADHIETHYHADFRRDLPPLIEAARTVERVHARSPSVPTGLTDVLAEFFAEMQNHMGKEEKILFPMIRRGVRGQAIYMPVRMMEREHDSHRDQLIKIRELTDDLRAPAGACATWTGLYRGLEAAESELIEHLDLENTILFVRATREHG
ncbi:MAG: hemerythrin domain-containing protein [Kofleriaceae bacterium]